MMFLLWLTTTIFIGISSVLSYSTTILTGKRRGITPLKLKGQEGVDDEKISSCPFARTFPRYRIDLTRSSRKKKEELPFFLRWNSWMPNLSNPQKNDLERQYPTSRIVWLENKDGIEAMASLWEEVSDILSSFDDKEQHVDEDVIIALPNCDSNLLLNWKELMDWIIDFEKNDEKGVIIVPKTTLLEEETAVRICCGINRKESKNNKSSIIRKIYEDGEVITQRQKAWVKRLLVNLSICPFTKSVSKSGQGLDDLGVPVGKIAYHVSRSATIYGLLADTWCAIHEMMEAGPSGKDGISSILLAAPNFDEDFSLWSGPIFSLLEQTVVAAQAEPYVGVVCFHPQYATPDGSTWPGFGQMHSVPRLQKWVKEEQERNTNPEGEEYSYSDVAAGGAWQRRTPHATINVLRADQLAMAESQRNSPKLYTRNIEVLLEIGNDQLLLDLQRERNIGVQDYSEK